MFILLQNINKSTMKWLFATFWLIPAFFWYNVSLYVGEVDKLCLPFGFVIFFN